LQEKDSFASVEISKPDSVEDHYLDIGV